MIQSEKIIVNKSDEKIFNFVRNFNNFSHLMPDQVENLKVTENECSFTIKGMPSINLKIAEKIPYSLVSMTSENEKASFKLNCLLENIDENNCYVQFKFDSELNSMVKMMIQKPLTNFLNTLAQNIKNIK
jgi:carbon monoxide dehydrogenase subunit G